MPARNIVVVCSGSHEKKVNLGEVFPDGSVRPVIEKVVPLGEAVPAYTALEAGGTVGKVVIRIA